MFLKLRGPLQFGITYEDSNRLIYRSRALGINGLEQLKIHCQNNHLEFPRTIIYTSCFGYNNWPLLGQFALEEISLEKVYGHKLIHSLSKTSTYLDGINPYRPGQVDVSSYINKKTNQFVDIHHNQLKGGVDSLLHILHTALTAPPPVLIHCFAGIHRTGMISMILRHLEGGEWTAPYKGFKTKLEWEYSHYAKLLGRRQNISFVKKFIHDQRFVDLKKSLEISRSA